MGGIIVSAGLIARPPQEEDRINMSSFIFPSSIFSFQGAVMIWEKKMKNIFSVSLFLKQTMVMMFYFWTEKNVRIRK
jgi:nitrate reductase gamma subunit